MYAHGRLCLSVPRRIPTLLHGPDVTWGMVSCAVLADLQSVHGFRCYDNMHVCKLIALYNANAYSAECEMPESACTRSVSGLQVATIKLITAGKT